MAAPAEARKQFTALAGAISGIRNAFDHEPEKFGRNQLPAVTMLLRQAPQEHRETGGSADVTWTWRVNLYVSTFQRYRRAQEDLELYVPLLLAITRRHPDLDGTCAIANLTDTGRDPFFDDSNHYVVKELVLTAETYEI
jgi:hypothetical protein